MPRFEVSSRGSGPSALALAIAAGLLACANGDPAGSERPDLTGVWGTYPESEQRGLESGAIDDLPLRAEAKARIEAYRALVAPTGDTPGGFCLGAGMPGSMLGSGGYPMEIVQHEDIILVVYEAHAEIRHIYLDERVADEDLFPDRNGYSFGRWEGPKLIVETTHLKEALDQRQFPHSDRATILEEYELTTGDDGSRVLVNYMTMTDPGFYAEPVTAEKKWAYLPGARLLPYDCNEPAWEEHLERLGRASSGG